MNTQTKPSSTEAIFVRIDLEASLGRIDDSCLADGSEDPMDCDPIEASPAKRRRSARTRSRFCPNPEIYDKNDDSAMTTEEDQPVSHVISPYPYSETDAEIMDREKLTKTVGYNWSIDEEDRGDGTCTTAADTALIEDVVVPPTVSGGWKKSFEIEPVPDDDDFSLSSEEAGSLLEEEKSFSLDKISEDPATFWEEGTMMEPASPEQSTIPSHVSFSSLAEKLEK